MKRFVTISLAGAMFAAAGLAQPGNSWFEQRFNAKYGRQSAMEESRQRAELANTAFREESASDARRDNAWFEQWFKTKYGRHSALEESRQNAELADTAFREEIAPVASTTTNSWLETWFKAKFGRSLR